jgi:Txe/YoeB family toxin of Txe-Axe toxin-antitoxin module
MSNPSGQSVKNGAEYPLSTGIGKPEPLKYRKGWSRHIDDAKDLLTNNLGAVKK